MNDLIRVNSGSLSMIGSELTQVVYQKTNTSRRIIAKSPKEWKVLSPKLLIRKKERYNYTNSPIFKKAI